METQRDCGMLLKQINDELEKRANNALRSQDLTWSQLVVLMELSHAPEGQMPLKDLEKAIHVAQSTAAGIVSRLESKGLVEPWGDPEDRRVKLVKLTAAGSERVEGALIHRTQAEERLLSGLTEPERAVFQMLLQKVCDSFR